MLEASLALPLEPENDSISEIEVEEDDPIESIYPVAYYGADYTVDDLVKRMQQGKIYIPNFQRNYVWNIKQASHFIESLLLGLPVPGIFLAEENDSQNLLVIDGSQRLRTLQYYYTGIFEDGKEFKLTDVQQRFMNITYNGLSYGDRRQLDESLLHATIVKQDEFNDNHSGIYLTFERLNTGGVSLTPQEVRSGIYHGYFKDVLAELNRNESWRAIYNNSSIPDKRLKDEELILRFMALFDLHQDYKKPMRNFLNNYMEANKKENTKLVINKDLFVKTIELIYRSIGNKAFRIRKKLNAAVFDSVMVGLATKIINSSDVDIQEETLKEIYDRLVHNEEFLTFVNTPRTTDDYAVKSRIDLAIKAFAEIP
ncbi:MAG: DUF262 domain-containing protein [Coleofasciculaceae cyanobacterium SM2_1_6]|nr:DUF262 domain-containing protein [Coleofasciculaceae cyanobacterium SM2_1_6]